VAAAAQRAGHEVTLLSGPVALAIPEGCHAVPFVTVAELKTELAARFDACDMLVMAAAVGDFRPEQVFVSKLKRSAGPVTVRLVPTEDVLGGVAAGKRSDQIVVAFAVEDGPEAEIEAKAQAELLAKNANYVVVNTPAAMAANQSRACILSREGVVLGWRRRAKAELAREILALPPAGAPS